MLEFICDFQGPASSYMLEKNGAMNTLWKIGFFILGVVFSLFISLYEFVKTPTN